MNPHKQAYFGAQEKAKANVVSLLKVLKVKEEMPLKPVLIKELILAAFSSHNGRILKRLINGWYSLWNIFVIILSTNE